MDHRRATDTKLVIGVDMGGTKIFAAIVRGDGKILGRAKKRTKPEQGPEEVIARITQTIRQAAQNADVSLADITALGIGILISTLARTQLEAFLLTFATVLPSVFLSGLFFPIEAMPGWLQAITYLVPARYAMVIMRGIILKGVGLEILREQVVAVIIFSVVLVTLAAARFKKKL